MKGKYFLILGLLIVMGCTSAGYHKQQVQGDRGETLTVGTVQRQIKLGMSSADVIQVLGSPNMVSTDGERREVWVYDKVASDVTYSQGGGFWTLILLGSDRVAGSQSTSQRTLTVVIKFDNDGKVRDFAYHASKF